jgi:hypothetical protein
MSTPLIKKFFPILNISARGCSIISAKSRSFWRLSYIYPQSIVRGGKALTRKAISLRPYLILSKFSCSKSCKAKYKSFYKLEISFMHLSSSTYYSPMIPYSSPSMNIETSTREISFMALSVVFVDSSIFFISLVNSKGSV